MMRLVLVLSLLLVSSSAMPQERPISGKVAIQSRTITDLRSEIGELKAEIAQLRRLLERLLSKPEATDSKPQATRKVWKQVRPWVEGLGGVDDGYELVEEPVP